MGKYGLKINLIIIKKNLSETTENDRKATLREGRKRKVQKRGK